MEENDSENMEMQNKSIFTSIKEKFGFKTSENKLHGKKSILSSIHNNSGEHNMSYQYEDSMFHDNNHLSKFITNNKDENEVEVPRKRVKFDEENLIVSSISYQRENALRNLKQQNSRKLIKEEESLFTKFINFTANLF